jgi:uncharacterized protein
MTSSANTKQPVVPEASRIIAQRLSAALHPDAIYLFGSHARGNPSEDSDLDFMVIVPESNQSRYLRSVEARRLVGDITTPKDIVVLTRKEWQEEQRVVCSLASAVRREGILLHG